MLHPHSAHKSLSLTAHSVFFVCEHTLVLVALTIVRAGEVWPLCPHRASTLQALGRFYLAHCCGSFLHRLHLLDLCGWIARRQLTQCTDCLLILSYLLCSNGSLFQLLGRSQPFCAFQFLLVCSFFKFSFALFAYQPPAHLAVANTAQTVIVFIERSPRRACSPRLQGCAHHISPFRARIRLRARA